MAERKKKRRRKSLWKRGVGTLEVGAQNALDILRLGRLGERRSAAFDVAHEERNYRLRHYHRTPGAPDDVRAPILLVPPLMLTAEIYDVAPEVSTVRMMSDRGIDAWVCDFGAPERQEGGLERTIDDHVRAVADAIDRVKAATGENVHVAGYSQGGMFAYQAAALRRSEGIASIVTFGSPVDIHRNIPALDDDLAARLIGGARQVLSLPIQHADRLPGVFSSIGFKLTSPKKELEQVVDFFSKLADRQALQRREDRRRFLAGEGFVAWPGPALRQFIDEFIVHNRMVSGGFVIDGQALTLADVTCPILVFVGLRDDIARAPSVRAIARAAPSADVFEVGLPAGHFGLVVGSVAGARTWPTVIEWLAWQGGSGPRPAALLEPDLAEDGAREVEDAAFDEPLDFDLFTDAVLGTATRAWKTAGRWASDVGTTLDSLRFQVPRVARLARIRPSARVSFGKALADQARRIPNRTFFLWRDRAFTYAEADRRVDAVTKGLIHCGVQRWQRVGLLMRGRPSLLSAATAINRLGAIVVLLPPDASEQEMQEMVELGRLDHLMCDPDHTRSARAAFAGPVLVLGGGGSDRTLGEGVVDMEAIDPDRIQLPRGFEANPGRAGELATVLFTRARAGGLRAAEITHRRWAFSAYGAAAGCTLTPKDTVYTTMPLHHPTGFLVSVGSALVSGSRLALATDFTPERFWSEVRRYGATVVFYAGDMCRVLVNAPSTPLERDSSLRLFAGSGMRKDVWRRVLERFTPAGVLEFYASTEGASILVNASGSKIGALGRPLPGSARLAVLAWDFGAGELVQRDGQYLRCGVGERGVLIAEVDATHPRYSLDGPLPSGAASHRVLRGVFAPNDAWFVTLDVVTCDEDGDHWFVDRVGAMVLTASGAVSTVEVEDRLYRVPAVASACVYGLPHANAEVPVASIVLRRGERLHSSALTRAFADVAPHARPVAVRVVERIALSDGFRPVKEPLRAAGIDGPGALSVHRWDAVTGAYRDDAASAPSSPPPSNVNASAHPPDA